MNKKALTVSLIIIMLCTLIVSGVAFAFYRQSLSGWEQNITATSVAFRLNGNTIETVTNYDLGLISRGQDAEVDFEVIVRANSSRGSIARFSLGISFNGENNQLANAIEVYYYDGGKYVFQGMLNGMQSIEGILPINTEKNFHYKFVYSPTASNYFEGKSFSLKLSASSSIYQGTSNMHFISSYEGLVAAAEAGSELSGKTLTLTRDITIPYDASTSNVVAFHYPVSIDLAGYTLTLETGTQIVITYTSSGKPSVSNSNPHKGGIAGDGQIIYNLPTSVGQEDFVYIQDNLTEYFSNFTVNDVAFSAIQDEMQAQLSAYSDGMLFVGDEIDFTRNLKYYFSNYYSSAKVYSITPPKNGGIDDTSVVEKTDASYTVFKISTDYVTPLTATNTINFALTSASGNNGVLNANFTVRGISSQAIVNYWLNMIPDYISGSVYFAGRDQATGSALTWITNSDILSDYGEYMKDGNDSLSSWEDTTVEIGVIIDTLGEQARGTKNVIVNIMNAEMRTEKIYNYQQIILDEVGSAADVYTDNVSSLGAVKAGLYDIDIAFVSPSQNLNNANLPYLQISERTNGDILTVLNKPSAYRAATIDVDITFTYKNGFIEGVQQYVSYTVRKSVTVVGYTAATELSDPTRFLQQDFDLNDYSLGNSYTFNVRSYTQKGANIDYFVSPAFSSYLYVQNDIYEVDDAGHFVNVDGDYVFFDQTYAYDAINEEYVSDLSGTYILSGGIYVDISQQMTNNEIYTRYSTVTVSPANVPAVAETMAVLTANIWEEKIDDVKQYLENNGERVVYYLNLVIKGIYHNISEEIEDFLLYDILKTYFDINGDGWIGIDEANVIWLDGDTNNLASELSTATIGDVTYSYINIKDKNISSLKGLEYFKNALGYDLSDNEIATIQYLNSLYKLKYLDLSNNKVADISDLEYLDALEIISLKNLPIGTIEPIRYLPSVRKLDLYHNENISTFEYIEDYKNLVYLDIRQSNRMASNSYDTSYYLSLVYDANRANNITIYRDGSSIWSVTDAEIVAAKVLSETVVTDEVYTTLNIPNSYYYEYTVLGHTYRKNFYIRWETDVASATYLTFTTVNGRTTGYTINTPIVDRIIPLSVSVAEVGQATAVAVTRKFRIKLLQSQATSDMVYIETSPSVFHVAKEVVPDPVLRSFLISISNITTTGYVKQRDANGDLTANDTTYSEAKTVSYAELQTADTNDYSSALNNADITDLTGISIFKDVIHFTLDLRGNTFKNADISELSELTNVTGIKLNGQQYDFSSISSYSEETGTPVITGLTGLTSLYVYGSFGLDDDNVLSALYQIYLANPSVSIYKDSDVDIWNPYVIPLKKYAQSLPSGFAFLSQNEEASYYEGEQTTYVLNFYGVKSIAFTLNMGDENLVGYWSGCFTHTATGIRYSNLGGYSDIVYDNVVLTGNDGRGALTCNHYIALKIDFNHKIKVIDYPQASGYVGLDTIFPGRDLRAAVLSKLSSLFSTSVSADDMNTIGIGYFRDGEYYYVTMATLLGLNFTASVTIDGTYTDTTGASAIQGLQYISATSVKISRDCNLGDGTYIKNLMALKIAYSGVDFSEIKQDLPNLTDLRLGMIDAKLDAKTENNRYTVLYSTEDGTTYYNLKHFIGLNTLYIIDSNTYDWTGLEGLASLDSNDIANLYIFGTADSYSNKNNNLPTTEAIVRRIYNNSTAATKDYRIGSPESATNNTYVYTGTGWTEGISGVTSIDYDYIKEYKDFASRIQSLGLKLNGVMHEFTDNQSITNGQTLYLPTTTYAAFYGSSFSTSIPLQRRFVIDWKIYGIDATLLNDIFGITANAANMTDYNYTNLSYCVIPANTNYADRNIVINAKAYDTYFVLQGTIGMGYVDNSGNYLALSGVTSYVFAYPVLIKGTATGMNTATITYRASDASEDSAATVTSEYIYNTTVNGNTVSYLSYAAFEDPNLRYEMFQLFAIQGQNSTGAYAKKGSILYTVYDGAATVLAGAYRVYKLIITSTTIRACWHSPTDDTAVASDISLALGKLGTNTATMYFSSLNGLNFFKNLNSIEIRNNLVSDISALGENSAWDNRRIRLSSAILAGTTNTCGLTSINMSENQITDISCLKDYTKLSTVTLYKNFINTLEYASGFVFANSINTLSALYLQGNSQISASDIAALRAAVVARGVSAYPTILNIDNTKCMYDARVLRDLGEIANYVSEDFNVTLHGASSVVTQADVNTYFSDIAGDIASGVGMGDYVGTGFQLGRNFSLSRSISGTARSYVLSLRNASNLINSDGSPNQKIYYEIAQTQTDLIIQQTGSCYAANFAINLIDISGSNPTQSPLYVNGILRTQDDFDPSLFVYIINNGINNGVTVSYTAPEILTINSEMGLYSLKGFEYFTTTTTLIIENQKNLTSLFTATVSNLTSLSLGSTGLTSSGMTGLRYATGLVTLNLHENEGIDYLKSISYQNGGNTVTTTTAEIILGLPSLKNLYIDNIYNFDVYGGNTGFQNLTEYMNGDNYLFGITTNGKKLSYYDSIDVFKTICNMNEQVKYYYNLNPVFVAEKYVTDNKTFNYGKFLNNSLKVFISSTNLSTAANYAALFGTGAAREILPSTLYQYGIEKTGANFYLPKDFYYAGEKYYFEWTLTSEGEYLSEISDGFLLSITKTNYQVADTSIVLSYALKRVSDSVTVTAGTKTIAIEPSEITVETSPNRLSPYYVEMPDGKGGTRLEPAVNYFKSTRLLYWYFNSSNNSIRNTILQVNVSNYQQLGMELSDVGVYYLGYEEKLTLTSLSIPNEGVTSLSGLELFANLTNITINEGATISLDALNNLQLTSFQYVNRSTDRNFNVLDFTPLYNSRDTLTTFTYTSSGYPAIDDMSFLMSFGSQLVTINLGVNIVNNEKSYNETLGFAYIIDWFAKYRPQTVIKYSATIVLPNDSEEQKAVDILSRINTDGTDITYVNNFEFRFNGGETIQDGIVTAKVPTYIDIGGTYYAVDWRSLSSFLTVNSLVYYGETFTAPFDTPRSIINGSTITESEYALLLASEIYKELLINGRGHFERTVSLADKNNNLLKMSYLYGRINVDGHDYERIFSINCSDNNQFKQILMTNGEGSKYLSLMGQTANYTGWKILNANGIAVAPVNGIVAYNGIRLTAFTLSGVTRQVLVITDASLCPSGSITLQNAEGENYVLYHNFTNTLRNNYILNRVTGVKNENYKTSIMIVGLDEYKSTLLTAISVLRTEYAEESTAYDAESYEGIVSCLDTAVSEVNAATSITVAETSFDTLLANLSMFSRQYSVSYNSLASGDGIAFAETEYYDENTVVTLPDNSAYTPEGGGIISGWFVNGIFYNANATFILTENVIVSPALDIIDYYVVLTGDENDYALSGYHLINGTYSYNSESYNFYVEHVQIVTNKVGIYKVISVGRNSGIIQNSSIATVYIDALGNYNFYVNMAEARIVAESTTYFFTLMGASGVLTNNNWYKPDEAMTLNYDRIRGFYYLTVTPKKAGNIKVCAHIVGNIKSGSGTPVFGRDYYALAGNAAYATGGDISITKTQMTIYFTPDAYAYNSNIGGNIVGFTGTAGINNILYATQNTGGVLIVSGTYAETVGIAEGCFSTEIVQ